MLIINMNYYDLKPNYMISFQVRKHCLYGYVNDLLWSTIKCKQITSCLFMFTELNRVEGYWTTEN